MNKETKIITAEFAHQATVDRIEMMKIEEFDLIMDKIEKAIEAGVFMIQEDCILYAQTVDKLKELGFKVKENYRKDENPGTESTRISWMDIGLYWDNE